MVSSFFVQFMSSLHNSSNTAPHTLLHPPKTLVGCIPVVADNTKHLIGMVTRTDLLRQHRYYQSLHYHNKGFSDSIAARKPIIELRKKLKKFDIENE